MFLVKNLLMSWCFFRYYRFIILTKWKKTPNNFQNEKQRNDSKKGSQNKTNKKNRSHLPIHAHPIPPRPFLFTAKETPKKINPTACFPPKKKKTGDPKESHLQTGRPTSHTSTKSTSPKSSGGLPEKRLKPLSLMLCEAAPWWCVFFGGLEITN